MGEGKEARRRRSSIAARVYCAVIGGLSFVIVLIPYLIVGGLIALFGYFAKRPRTITTLEITQDITIRKPMEEPPLPIKKVIICPNCGGENDAMDVFCGYCGRRLKRNDLMPARPGLLAEAVGTDGPIKRIFRDEPMELY